MAVRWGHWLRLTALLCALWCVGGCRESEAPEEASGPLPDGDDDSTIEPSPPPDEHWGLWHGAWQDDRFVFEEVPCPGALSPNLAAQPDGGLAVIGTRKTQETTDGETVYHQLIYLTRRLTNGEWRDPMELARFSWSSQNTALLADADGSLHVLFSYEGQPTHLHVVDNVVTPRLMIEGPSPPDFFSLAQSPLGFVHSVFGSWSLSHQVLIGDEWHVIETFDDGRFPDLAFDPTQLAKATLVFLRYKGIGDASTLLRFTWNEIEWNGEVVLPDVDFYPVPRVLVDPQGRVNILAPSAQGLLYLVEDAEARDGWRMEVVAGADQEMGQENADLAWAGDTPVVAYRDARTARGFAAFRFTDGWTVGEFQGFNGGFVGLNLAVDAAAAPHVLFAGARELR
jgi:hypothetical protein